MRHQYPVTRWAASPSPTLMADTTRAAVLAFLEDEPGWAVAPSDDPEHLRVIGQLDDRAYAFTCHVSNDDSVLTLWTTIVDPVPRRRHGQVMRLLNDLNCRARMGAFVLVPDEEAVRWRACVHLGLPGACVPPDACLLRPLFYLSALYTSTCRNLIADLASGQSTQAEALAEAALVAPPPSGASTPDATVYH